MLFLCLILNLFASAYAFSFFNPYLPIDEHRFDKPLKGRVIITPYVESGNVDEVRKLIRVPPLKGTVDSYAGYATVNKICDSNLFFWFFPAEFDAENAPISIWLQGGPGASSLYGLFLENGPYFVKSNNKLSLRKYSWTKITSMLYIDNPVGTGFSYANSSDCYSKDEEEIGKNLLSVVKQVLQVFPNMSSNPLYVTGESYAGKYVPALAHAIHHDNDQTFKINLKGLALGNGLVDPYNQLHYSLYLKQLGLIDFNGQQLMSELEDTCRNYISKEMWTEAFHCFDRILNGDTRSTTVFKNLTGFNTYYNYLFPNGQPENNFTAYVTQEYVRLKINVGNATFHDGKLVEQNLMNDVMKSVRPWLEELLENYKVLIYNGQLDIIVAYPLTESYLQVLNWTAAAEYKNASRHIWMVGDDLAGYVKSAGKLTEVMVRNAGHMVPKDQPKWALDMMSRFIADKTFR